MCIVKEESDNWMKIKNKIEDLEKQVKYLFMFLFISISYKNYLLKFLSETV